MPKVKVKGAEDFKLPQLKLDASLSGETPRRAVLLGALGAVTWGVALSQHVLASATGDRAIALRHSGARWLHHATLDYVIDSMTV